MTLLDFPGRVACTVFLGGCNFRCPYCHNSELLDGQAEPVMDDAALLAFLEKRKGLLDGVCVTGGEPTLQPGLAPLLRQIRAMGYQIKLDTNGSRPQVLQALLEEGLVDYVAMDIKNGPRDYASTVGLQQMDLAPLEQSIRLLTGGSVDYEFRTTLVAQLHTERSVLEMGQWLKETAQNVVRRLFLQKFVDRETVMFAGLQAPNEADMEHFRNILQPFAETVEIRGEH